MSIMDVNNVNLAKDAFLLPERGGGSNTTETGSPPPAAEMADDSQFHTLCAELERAREEIRLLKSAGAGAWP
jgi:hypothetical protein